MTVSAPPSTGPKLLNEACTSNRFPGAIPRRRSPATSSVLLSEVDGTDMLTFLSRTHLRFPSRCAPFAPVLDVPASDHTRDVVASGSKVDGLFLKETWQLFLSDCSPLLQCVGWTSYSLASCASVFSSLKSSSTTRALNAALDCFLIMFEYILFQPLPMSKFFLGP
jgi:hypothetical protein